MNKAVQIARLVRNKDWPAARDAAPKLLKQGRNENAWCQWTLELCHYIIDWKHDDAHSCSVGRAHNNGGVTYKLKMSLW